MNLFQEMEAFERRMQGMVNQAIETSGLRAEINGIHDRMNTLANPEVDYERIQGMINAIVSPVLEEIEEAAEEAAETIEEAAEEPAEVSSELEEQLDRIEEAVNNPADSEPIDLPPEPEEVPNRGGNILTRPLFGGNR